MEKKKLAVFSGAGISRESDIDTFRDMKDGLWYNYDINDVATAAGFKKNPKLVMDFHNMLRGGLAEKEPNSAHKDLVRLEEFYDVTIITQNVDNLHEKAGSSDVYHLHGELFKSRSVNDFWGKRLYDCFGDLNLGDLNEEGEQLRPHTVLFDEMPYNVDEGYKAFSECDVLIVVGTSLPIFYTLDMLRKTNSKAKVFYLDPAPSETMGHIFDEVEYVKEPATKGMTYIYNLLTQNNGNI